MLISLLCMASLVSQNNQFQKFSHEGITLVFPQFEKVKIGGSSGYSNYYYVPKRGGYVNCLVLALSRLPHNSEKLFMDDGKVIYINERSKKRRFYGRLLIRSTGGDASLGVDIVFDGISEVDRNNLLESSKLITIGNAGIPNL